MEMTRKILERTNRGGKEAKASESSYRLRMSQTKSPEGKVKGSKTSKWKRDHSF